MYSDGESIFDRHLQIQNEHAIITVLHRIASDFEMRICLRKSISSIATSTSPGKPVFSEDNFLVIS
jgi:hypothetical protein